MPRVKVMHHFFRKQRARKGSLLVEALLAVTILSVAITLIIQSMTASLRASVYSTQYTQALILIENKILDHLQNSFSETPLKDIPNIENVDEKYVFSFKKDLLEESDLGGTMSGFEQFEKLSLSVNWKSGRRQNKISLDTLLLESAL